MTNEQRLADARDALHQLMMGKRAVQVGYGSRQVTYSQTTIADLRRYISELENLCGQSQRKAPGRVFL